MQPSYGEVRPVAGRDEILAERGEAARVRDEKLDPVSLDVPLVVDLSSLRIITFSAADELLANWLVIKRNRHRDQAVVVAFYSPRAVIQETLDAVLKARGLAAYGLRQSKDPGAEQPELLGEVTRTNADTLAVVRRVWPQGITSTELAQRLELADTAAIARLQELVSKGLIQRGTKVSKPRGRPSTLFLYPFRAKQTARNPVTPGVKLPA
jgi:hypothetical protein